MSQQVTINGKKFEPSAVLARQFGYSMDYVSRLAREGKIEATRIGHQWFVEATSLNNFLEKISKQKEINREKLRAERKLELISNTDLIKSKTNLSSIVEIVPANWSNSRNLRNYLNIVSASVGTTLVIVAGMLSVVIFSPNNFYSFYASLDFNNFKHSLAPQRNTDISAGAFGSWTQSEPTKTPLIEEDDTKAKGIILFDEEQSEKELERIRASFSDEVEINFKNEDTGVITPVFLKHKGDNYQFLMVPVGDAS